MRKTTVLSFYISAFFFLFFLTDGFAQDFITTWETTADTETIIIPTEPGETYLYDVDWENDGTFDAIGITGDAMHEYPVAGVYQVAVRGTFPRIFFNNAGDKDKIIIINQWGTNQWTSMANAFEGCSNLVIADMAAPDLTLAADLSAMFKDATALNSPIGNWTVSTISNMSNMFAGAINFDQNISTWNVGVVSNMANMFDGATSFDQNLGGWDVSGVTDMTDMFANGAGLSIENYDELLIGWSSQTLQNSVSFNAGLSEYCFGAAAKALIVTNFLWTITDAGENCADVFTSTWKTDNLGTSMDNEITIPTTGPGYMYEVSWGDGTRSTNVVGDITHTYAASGTYIVKIRGSFPRIYFNNGGDKDKILSVDNWGAISWTSMSAAFFGCTNLAINAGDAPDLSGVTSLSQLFKGATSFDNNIDNWDVSTIMNLSETFSQATSFNQDLSGWVTIALTNLDATFSQSGFNQPINSWDVSNVTTMEGTFAESPFNQPLAGWNTMDVLSMDSMFANALDFNQNINAWDVSNVENMQGMFLNAEVFNQPLAGWIVTSAQTMEGMFSNTDAFNQPIGSWVVTTVTNMSGMFTDAIAFNQPIGSWTVDNVTDMSNMFNGAITFNQDLNLWDVSQVTNFTSMFASAESFDGDIISWTTGSAIIMANMLSGTLVFNQNISNWDTSSVLDMREMFTGAEAFDQNIGAWDVSMVADMENMFSGATLSIANYDALIIGWDAQILQSGISFNGGNSRYCDGATARNNMITNDGWVITDAGQENIDPVPDILDPDTDPMNVNPTAPPFGPGLPDFTSECALTAFTTLFMAPTATDACAGIITATTDAFPINQNGENIVSWVYDDSNGNTVTQFQRVFITDATEPVVSAVSNITATANAAVCSAIVNYTPPTATDNCSFTLTSTNNPGDSFPVGITTVTYTATDTAGNIGSESFTITVTDNEPPVFSGCLLSFTVNADLGSCGAIVNYTAPTASDNCGVFLSATNNSGDFFAVGTTTVTYIASDSGGNSATCTFDITVADTVDPIFSGCPANIIVNNDPGLCTAAVFYAAPVATDNCSVSVTSTNNPGEIFPTGVTNVSYTAMDPAGNAVSCTFSITVLDAENPVISSCPIDIVQAAGGGTCVATVSWTPPLRTDNCSATLSSTHAPGDVFTSGVTTVIYTATDPAGNTDICSFTVTVFETEDPVISNCPADISVSNEAGNCGATVSFTPPTQTDNCGANLTSSNAPGDFFPVGTTAVLYTATDTSGNTATCGFVITVLDTENPTFTTCPGDITVANDLGSCDALVSWTPPISADNCSASVTASHDPGDEFQLGTTLVTYTATDPAGNSVICSFNVTVTDDEMPVITNCPVAIVVANDFGDCDANVSWTPPVATDNCVSLTFTSSHDSGDMFPVGITTVTYTATDAAGNVMLCSFTVTVQDTEIPDIDCPTNSSVFVDLVDYVVPDYVAEGLIIITDNCTTEVTNVVQTPAPGTLLAVGSYPVSIVANDDALNEAICTFTLSVEAVLETEGFELNKTAVTLYPSPAASIVYIEVPPAVQLEKITVYDIIGRMVKVENFSTNKISLDISELASATYLLQIQTNFGTFTKQLIKE
jgi:hypothetical protein